MKLSAKQVYDKLLNEDNILRLEGQIKFFLGDVSIIVKQRDVVGNIMQGWLDARGIEYAPSENTQMPPDFFLNPSDKTKDLLEVKAFNRNAGPGFDIADFKMYQREIIREPYMLDVDYLIFGYDMSSEGVVTIKDVWLKKVWEITRRMEAWPLNLQIKQNVVHKIRPGIWYGEGSRDYAIFGCLEDFISAVEETVYRNPDTRAEAGAWEANFLRSYKQYFGRNIIIPRWFDIQEKYDLKTPRMIEKLQSDREKAILNKNKIHTRVKTLMELYQKAIEEGDENNIKRAKVKLDEAQEKADKATVKLDNIENEIKKNDKNQ